MSRGQAAFLGLWRVCAVLLGIVGLFTEESPSILFAILMWMIANTIEANFMVIVLTKKLSERLTGGRREHVVPEPPQRWDEDRV